VTFIAPTPGTGLPFWQYIPPRQYCPPLYPPSTPRKDAEDWQLQLSKLKQVLAPPPSDDGPEAAEEIEPHPVVQEQLTVLQEAQKLVYGDREAAYSHPYDDFKRIAGMWSAYLDGVKITPQDVAQMMVLLKTARVRVDVVHGRKPKRDTLIDIAGYAECGSRVAEKE
jgi:hypothetical protein